MGKVAILGAGAGGAAAAAELSLAGHRIRLWNRSASTLAPFQQLGGVAYEGVLGQGVARPECLSTRLEEVLQDADVALVCVPTLLHGRIARQLAALRSSVPVILNPGHTGGALEFSTAYADLAGRKPAVAQFSTLTYVARKYEPQMTTITGAAKSIRLASLPGGDAAAHWARTFYPRAVVQRDVLACDLANVNMVVHPPGAVLGAAWVEATRGDFTFYVQGMTPGVARVMRRLDDERRRVARALGHDLPSVIEEMQALGTVQQALAVPDDLAAAIASGEANRRIKAPDSLQHRYYLEDFGHGLLPFVDLAAIAGVTVPTATALLSLGSDLTGVDFRLDGRTAQRMGIGNMDKAGLLRAVANTA